MINATITIIKNKTKENISYSVSKYADGNVRSYNFTGNLTSVSNYYTADGKDISEALVKAEVPTTVIVNNIAMAEAILEKAADIFMERELNGDLNPAIELEVVAKTLRVPGNILISFVAKAHVTGEAQIQDDSATVLANLEKGKLRLGQQMAQATQNAPRKSGGVMGFVKSYF